MGAVRLAFCSLCFTGPALINLHVSVSPRLSSPRPAPHRTASHSYVPVKVDYSDVYDIMAFFVGMPDGSGGHDSLAAKIGEAGRQWARDFWRYEDMACVSPSLLSPSLSLSLSLAGNGARG